MVDFAEKFLWKREGEHSTIEMCICRVSGEVVGEVVPSGAYGGTYKSRIVCDGEDKTFITREQARMDVMTRDKACFSSMLFIERNTML